MGTNSYIWTNGGAPTFKADALTNYRPESIGLDHPIFEDGALERRIEPVNLFQGLDAGGMNYAEAVGLDSSIFDVVNTISGSASPGGDDI